MRAFARIAMIEKFSIRLIKVSRTLFVFPRHDA
jgi:hypothetical protein